MTAEKIFATDVSNASRTMLYNIHTMDWDEELLRLFSVPRSMLPEVRASSGILGYTDAEAFGCELPIAGIAGDQQSALIGQGCYAVGDAKNTYGTGGFLLMNIGNSPTIPKSGILTTVAWKIGDTVTYAAEGSVFVCGAAIQWLRDGLGLIATASETEEISLRIGDNGGVYVVPAFCGLGAPYWDPHARGSIHGLTRGTTRDHIVRATVESMAYQTNDLLYAIREECGVTLKRLKVDGGAAANDFLLSFQASVSDITVERPKCTETTALGAALLAGLGLSVYADLTETAAISGIDSCFRPNMEESRRTVLLNGWRDAVARTQTK